MAHRASAGHRELGSLLRATARELTWGLWGVSRELAAWRGRARTIPDGLIREDALRTLHSKRNHIDGAALFSILPRARSPALLRTLVAYELILELLDELDERTAHAGRANGLALHVALVEALQPGGPTSEYYLRHPRRDDGGYLRALVGRCRESAGRLPSYPLAREMLLREAARAGVLALNHDPDPASRDRALMAWARREIGELEGLSWFECSGAATSSTTVHALLALAAEPACARESLEAVQAAYFPWLSLATTMLDSYVDQQADAEEGEHSYIGHYASPELAVGRLAQLIVRAIESVRRLPDGERHAVIASCMVAMYLSGDRARAPEMREATRTLVRAGGSLTRLLLPVLRAWRVVHGQRWA